MVVGVEDVGIGRNHLCGFRSLDALLESAAVGYAAKWAGNILRIIRHS